MTVTDETIPCSDISVFLVYVCVWGYGSQNRSNEGENKMLLEAWLTEGDNAISIVLDDPNRFENFLSRRSEGPNIYEV